MADKTKIAKKSKIGKKSISNKAGYAFVFPYAAVFTVFILAPVIMAVIRKNTEKNTIIFFMLPPIYVVPMFHTINTLRKLFSIKVSRRSFILFRLTFKNRAVKTARPLFLCLLCIPEMPFLRFES